MPPLLTVSHLGKRFGERRVLDDVSFSIERGEVLALVGASGSGKSTVARIVSGLLAPSEGTVRRDGGVQMIFQDPFASLNPVHTVRYHLARPLKLHKKSRTVPELLAQVGLTPADEIAAKHPHQLSGGQRQRVAIARALAPEPSLIVADEPTSMLDASIRIDILNLLRDLRGVSLLYITHDLASARYLADRVIVLCEGRVVETGGAAEVLETPSHPYTRALIDALPQRVSVTFARPRG